MPLQIVYERELPSCADVTVCPVPSAHVPDARDVCLCANHAARTLRAPGIRQCHSLFAAEVPFPVWSGGDSGETDAAAGELRRTAELALSARLSTVVVTMGAFADAGYPVAEVVHASGRSLAPVLESSDIEIYLAVRGNPYVDGPPAEAALMHKLQKLTGFLPDGCEADTLPTYSARQLAGLPARLANRLSAPSETFTEMLLRKIEASGMTDAQCYRRANVDRRVFAKIRSNRNYRPKKTTVVAFAFALKLNSRETRDLLEAAGYSFSNAAPFDIIVQHFISSGNFDIYELNEVLFAMNEKLVCV